MLFTFLMKIKENLVSFSYGEVFDILHQRDRDLYKEVLETLTEVAEVAYETDPCSYGQSAEKYIDWSENGIQFAFAEVA